VSAQRAVAARLDRVRSARQEAEKLLATRSPASLSPDTACAELSRAPAGLAGPGKLAPRRRLGGTLRAAVHFFLDNYRFETVWTRPKRGLSRIRSVGAALAPDFSLWRDMPRYRPERPDVGRVTPRRGTQPRSAAVRKRFVICCAVCALSGGPFGGPEAAYHATTHDLLLHGGRPTTLLRPATPARTHIRAARVDQRPPSTRSPRCQAGT
jgi:Domain of unknown function (DUF4417)